MEEQKCSYCMVGILIGMVIWQIVAIILFTINEDKILFKNILGGIPLLALYILFSAITDAIEL